MKWMRLYVFTDGTIMPSQSRKTSHVIDEILHNTMGKIAILRIL